MNQTGVDVGHGSNIFIIDSLVNLFEKADVYARQNDMCL